MNVGYPTLEAAAIPGDAAGLRALGGRLQLARDDIELVQRRIASDGLRGAWTGPAAERFRGSLERLPGELGAVAAAFDEASISVTRFARELVAFQDRAHRYAQQIDDLEVDRQAMQLRHDEAQADVAQARIAKSGATDPLSLRAAGAALELGIGRLQLAVEDMAHNEQEIARLRRCAQQNREEYERGVLACCAALDSTCAAIAGSGPQEGGRQSASAAAPSGLFSYLSGLTTEMAASAEKAVTVR